MKTEESGRRIKVRGTINAREDSAAIAWLVRRLACGFGGCTVLPGAVGYWVSDDDTTQCEEATIIEVSFPAANTYAGEYAVIRQVRHLFATTQYTVGGEWCHIEVSEFEAAHTHHEHFACCNIA